MSAEYKYLPLGVKEKDGRMWWTVNSEIYKDASGASYPVDESRLMFEDSYGGWRFKYDKSAITKLFCKDGEYLNVTLVKALCHDNGQLKLTLADDTVLTYPWQESFDIFFSDKETITCVPGYSVNVNIRIEGASAATKITAAVPEGWTCEYVKSSDNEGTVLVTAPANASFPAELTVTAKDGSSEVTRTATIHKGVISTDASEYSATCDETPITVKVNTNIAYSVAIPSECKEWLSAYQSGDPSIISFTASANTVKSARSADVSLLDVKSKPMCTFRIIQSGVGAFYFNVSAAEFNAAEPNDEDYFVIKGTPSDFSSDGPRSLSDASGSILVAGLENYARYSSRFTATTKLVLQGHRGSVNGTPALTDASIKYFIDNSAKAAAGWMELPAVYDADGFDFYHHPMTIDGTRTRNYSFYWDPEALVSHWVAYPLNSWLRGSGSRSDKWGIDPLLPADKQPLLLSPFGDTDCHYNVDRGHQLPSADRYRSVSNVETFYGTNMTPQLGSFNSGLWVTLETQVRYWSTKCDTLYVVTGCTVDDRLGYALDNNRRKVAVPGHYFKTVLAYSKDPSFGHNGYLGLAIWLEHRYYSDQAIIPRMVTSIDELEALTGDDYFANLPAAIGEEAAEAVENENPASVSWWW